LALDVAIVYKWLKYNGDTPLLFDKNLPIVSRKVYLETIPKRMNLSRVDMSYRFPEFDDVRDSTKDLNV